MKSVGELAAEQLPGEAIHDHHQIVETLLQLDIRDIGSLHLIQSQDHADIHQARKALGWNFLNRGLGFLISHP